MLFVFVADDGSGGDNEAVIIMTCYLCKGGYVFIGFSFMFVSRIMQKLLIWFSQNLMDGGTWPRKKTLDFGGNLDHIMIALRLELLLDGRSVTSIC